MYDAMMRELLELVLVPIRSHADTIALQYPPPQHWVSVIPENVCEEDEKSRRTIEESDSCYLNMLRWKMLTRRVRSKVVIDFKGIL
jgi:hypothetical protein